MLGRGSARWRGGVLALLPWVLMLPSWQALWADPARVLGGAGATVASPVLPLATPAWQLALLDPGAPQAAGSLAAVPLWLTVPCWLGALGALLLPGRRGRRAGVLVAAALVCLGLSVLAARTGLGVLPQGHVEAGLVVTAWPGTLLSLAGAALLLGTALAVDGLLAGVDGRAGRATVGRDAEGRTPEGRAPAGRARRGWVTALAVLLVGVPAALAFWPLAPWSSLPDLARGADPLPAGCRRAGPPSRWSAP